MSNKLEFNTRPNDDGLEGVFYFSSPLEEELDVLLEELEGQSVDGTFADPDNRQQLMDVCSRMVNMEPAFLDAYVHAAGALLENDEADAAEIWYKRGLDQAYAVMPSDFKGQISWYVTSNRPFMRLHHGYILCLLKHEDLKPATQAMEQHLTWNPTDSLGIGEMLADVYVVLGKDAKARKLMKGRDRPHFFYNLALLDLHKGEYCKALTNFRKGFLANPYIAEKLLGTNHIFNKPGWIPTSEQTMESAQDYLQGPILDAWENADFEFLNWAYNCSLSLKDRATWTDLRERIDATHDFNNRGAILEKMNLMKASINDTSSAPAIISIENRYGEVFPVWDPEAYK